MWTKSKQIYEMRKWTLYMYIISIHTLSYRYVIPWTENTQLNTVYFVDRRKRIAMKQLEIWNSHFVGFFFFSSSGIYIHARRIPRIWAKNITQMIVFLFNWNKCHNEIFHPHRFVWFRIYFFQRCKCFSCTLMASEREKEGRGLFVFSGDFVFWFACVPF